MDPEYRRKLKSLGVYFGSKGLIDFKPRDKININNLPGVRKTNSFGEFFFVEHEFSPNYQHGAIPFKKFFNSRTVY
jgi:hypothetical protein